MNALKKKKDADEQQRLQEALEEFRETFEDGNGRRVPKSFIRGDIVNADKSLPITPTVYKPTPVAFSNKATAAFSVENAVKRAKETADKIMQQAARQGGPSMPGSVASASSTLNRPLKIEAKKSSQSSKMSNLEMFKEELKQLQEMREGRKGLRQQLKEKFGDDTETLNKIVPALDNAFIGSASEFDDDPSTTNLYVSNMPLDIQMEDLYETFGTFGPLASAKILHPKPDDERRLMRTHLCGFIAYMSRTDATRAMCVMAGERMKDGELRVSWARPVPIPPIPFYVPIALRELAMPDPPSGLPFNAKPLSSDLRCFLRKYQNLPRHGTPMPDNTELVADYKQMIANAVVRVVIPTERPLLALIHRVIEFLIREGPVFEAILMAHERANPMYRFLFENHHPTHVYYRWKLYSILQGDDKNKWRLERFRMFEGGSWWEPPPHSLFENGMPPQLYDTAYVPRRRTTGRTSGDEPRSRKRNHSVRSDSDESDDERDGRRRRSPSGQKKYRGVLNDDERRDMERHIQNIMPDKTSIGDAMVWCLDHADCAKEIVQYIYESLALEEMLHKKIARIYLCSDILANCGARLRDVFYYRQYFGDMLVKIFVSLNETLESIQSRIKAEQFRQRVMLCFRMWEDNSIYPTETLINLQNIFLGLAKPAEESADEDLDGEPIAADDIDGVPLQSDDIDGVPLDAPDDSELIFSEKMTKKKAPIENESLFMTSSWSQVTDDTEGGLSSKWDSLEDAPSGRAPVVDRRSPMSDQRPGGLSQSSNNGGGHSDAESDADDSSGVQQSKEFEKERRKMLRDIEVKVVKLQDELEADRHCKNIDEELAQYRKRLTEKMDEKLTRLFTKRSNASIRKEAEKSPKSASSSLRRKDEPRSRDRELDRSRERETREPERSRDRERDRSRERTSSRYDRDRDRDDRDRRRDRDRQDWDRKRR